MNFDNEGGGEDCEESAHGKVCNGPCSTPHVRHHVGPCFGGVCQDWLPGVPLPKKSSSHLLVAFLIRSPGWTGCWELMPLSFGVR